MKVLLSVIFIITVTMIGGIKKVYFLKHDHQKQCYLKDVLVIINHNPNQLAVNKRTNTLFFSTDVSQGKYVPFMVNIDTKKVNVINGVKDAYAIASNDKADDIYFGGSNGIHRYRPIEKTLTSLAITNLDVWWLYFKKYIHFVQFPHLNAYVYKDRTIKAVRQLSNTVVHQFVFDRDGHIFFVNASGLYGVKKLSYQHVLLRGTPSFLGMATDNTGQVFVCSDTGVYVVSKTDQNVKRIVRISGVMAMTFDKDNHMIYSDSQELVRLVPVASEAFNSSRDDKTYFCS